jgi:hypothetical protein
LLKKKKIKVQGERFDMRENLLLGFLFKIKNWLKLNGIVEVSRNQVETFDFKNKRKGLVILIY